MKSLIVIASFLVVLAGTLDIVAPRTMEACVLDVALLEVEAPHYTLDDLCVAGNNKVTVIIRCASGSRYASQASLSPCLQQPIVTLQYDTKGAEATNITLLLWLNLGHDVLDSASFIFSPVGDSIFSANHVLGDLQKTRFHLAVAKRCFGGVETERASMDEAADAGGSQPFPNSAFSSLNHLTARHRRDTDATLRPLKTGAQASLTLDVSPAILTRDSSPGVETVFIGESFARDDNFPVVTNSLDSYFSEFYSKRTKVEPLPASPDETALLGNSVPGNDLYLFGEAVSDDNSTLLTFTSTQTTSQPLQVTAPRVTSSSIVTSELPENSLGHTSGATGSTLSLNSSSQAPLNFEPKETRSTFGGSLTDDTVSLSTGELETSDPTYQSTTTAGPYTQPKDFTSVSFFEETIVFGNNAGRSLFLETKDDVTSPEAKNTAADVTRTPSDGTTIPHTSVAGDYSQQDLKESAITSTLMSRASLTSTVAILSSTSDAGTVLNPLESTDTTASPLEFVSEGVNPLGRSTDTQTGSDSHMVSESQLDTSAQTISDSLTASTESTLGQGPSDLPDTSASVVVPVASLSPLDVSVSVHRPESTVSSQHLSPPTSPPQTSHTPPTDSSPLTTPSTPTSRATDSPTEATSLTTSSVSHSPEQSTSPITTSTSTQQQTHPTVPTASVQPQAFSTIPTPPSQQQTFQVSSSIAPSSPGTPVPSPTLPEQDTSSTSSTASSDHQPDVPVTPLFPDAQTSSLPSDLTTNITLETGSRGNSSSWEGPINNSDRGDDAFWPIVAALVIGIPTVIVFGIAIVVIYKRRLASPARLRAASMYPSLKIDQRRALNFGGSHRPSIDV